MREIGKGLNFLKMLCGYLNMPPPMQIVAFNFLQTKKSYEIVKTYETVVTDSVNNAAHELSLTAWSHQYLVTQENVLITVFPPNTVPRANLGKLKKI